MSETKHSVRTWLLMLLTVFMIGLSARSASAATNMVSVAKANTYTSQAIVQDRYGYRFRGPDGKYVRDKWIRFNGFLYSFKANSYANRGWFKYDGQTYFANSKGQIVYGRFITIGGKKYYLHSSGKLLVNSWLKLNGNYFRLGAGGVLYQSKMFTVGTNKYYAASNGVILKNKWIILGGHKYYLGASGAAYTNRWVLYNGKYYYLTANGTMAVNTTVGGYRVGSDGARIVVSPVVDEKPHYLFVGDSRTVGMDYMVSDENTDFIAKISMGYDWLISTAHPQVKSYIAKYPNLTVVFAFGVNDLGNVDKYIYYYKLISRSYPKVKFRFMSINPINEKKYSTYYRGTLTNKMIYNFNMKLQAAVGSAYVNSYKYLFANNPVTTDGLHYDGATNLRIYNWVMSQIKTA